MNREKAIGVLFISIAIGIFIPSILSIFIEGITVIIWLISITISILLAFILFKDLKYTLKHIFSNSSKWSNKMKIVNGIAWALPFLLATIYPTFYPYLILLGIGLGNLTTYIMIRSMNGFTTRGQALVGITSLSFLPLIAIIYNLGFDASYIMRLLVAVAYGIGGMVNLAFNSPN
ncbi:MAG: hypothetical protein KatS3mg003_2388 [Candidatus Nitrosocaldaceae archaeon]|nr:MAG: hypothetical protein KatS3mg003_1329 [Candidatus Nitrosocaldaceae archaeon]GIU72909.1 MAG: hypothetical protein KatS3mg003_2388 [Candidatus Nitrosocaldaceae archaeon]